MSSERGLELSAEVDDPERRKVGGVDLERKSDLTRGQELTAVVNDADVALVISGRWRAVALTEAPSLVVQRGAHVAVAIPARLAVLEAHAVQHAVTEEPVR